MPGWKCFVIATVFNLFGNWTPIVHGVNLLLNDLGRTPGQADNFARMLGLGGLIFRIPIGLAADKFGRLRALATVHFLLGAFQLLLYRVALLEEVPWLVQLWAIPYGACVGASMFLTPACVAEIVGIKLFALGFSIAFGFVAAPALLFGPVVAGAGRDLLGSYEPSFTLTGVCCLVTCESTV